jgi:hypothetical protein
MRILLTISIATFLIACGADPERGGGGGGGGGEDGPETKSYTVTTDGGNSCSVMIRRPTNSYSSLADFTLSCPRNTKIGCFRVYDSSKFILGTESGYVYVSEYSNSYGLIAADGYGNGTIYIMEKEFNSIASVSLHETSCN